MTEPEGVWVSYYWDANLIVDTIHLNEIDALRAVNGLSMYKAGFVPFGIDVREALK